ncbi:MAG: FAD-dependent oxidoreductase [Phaeodactylibacter sp.]|uniref:FAD-dependent oxidoreductase n=1 Tax=Phaeodactylibacter sp. TaxID=1940289 RepID=UPI0032F02A22
MKKHFFYCLFVLLAVGFTACTAPSVPANSDLFDVLVVGEGTGGTAAALQAARSGAKTALVNPLPWYGGMLTSAGVSAIDGNHEMPAGLWGEFRSALYDYYGGPDAVFTGWVSNTQFEPHVGAATLDSMVQREPNLKPFPATTWDSVWRESGYWAVRTLTKAGPRVLKGKILIDGTDLGDVAAAAGADFWVGMDSRSSTGESMAPAQSNDIVQDLTYVAILKDYGAGKAPLLEQPEGYDPEEFFCLCRKRCDDPERIECDKMLDYGKLPNGKYMINWPIIGNDYYVNVMDMRPVERAAAYERAKNQTKQFVYYLQHELGYTNLGLADDEFPTKDQMALMPYHREGRRIKGLVLTTINHIQSPYQTDAPFYRTGIAVGDYPVDHHHEKNPAAPEIDFPKVPSFNIPAGSLVAKGLPNLLMADKAISVTNIANGSTRLQPVILQVGQAAGLMAALAADRGVLVSDLPVRAVQQGMLDAGGYLMPYYDVKPGDPHFAVIHRIGATGLLSGTGEPYKWANRTWYYPDSVLVDTALAQGLARWGIAWAEPATGKPVRLETAKRALVKIAAALPVEVSWRGKPEQFRAAVSEVNQKKQLNLPEDGEPVTRRQWTVLMDELVQPFQQVPVTFEGKRK